LLEWNKKFRTEESNILSIENSSETTKDKIKLLEDWQDFLATEWLDIIVTEKVKNNGKWFNDALRKFAIKFLDYTETLDNDQRQKLKLKLNELIS
jgi:hypothetical protein